MADDEKQPSGVSAHSANDVNGFHRTNAADEGWGAQFKSKPAIAPTGAQVPENMVPTVTAEHDEQDVLVTFSGGRTAAELTRAIEESGCTLPQIITDEDVAAGFATLRVTAEYDVEHAMTQLGMLPEIGRAQPNFKYRLHAEQEQVFKTGDARAAQLGNALQTALPGRFESGRIGMHRRAAQTSLRTAFGALAPGISADSLRAQSTDPKAAAQWMLDSVHAYEAWDVVKTDHAVTVAVIDDGFLVTHEDLQANILRDAQNNMVAYNAVGDSPRFGTTDVQPLWGTNGFSHGTHVAGIIAAQAGNGVGGAGVSYNACILPIQVFQVDEEDPSDSYADSADLVRAYSFILTHADEYGIRVVNMSLGGEGDLDEDDRAVLDKVEEAYRANILTVCSAGNNAGWRGAYEAFPCDSAEHALGVIALQEGFYGDAPSRAAWSNYNMAGQRSKRLAAPGNDILSTSAEGERSYERMSGTSMAAPCVSGVAALVYASLGGSATAGTVADVLCSSAGDLGDLGWDAEYGYGEVDAYEAVLAATHGISIAGERTLLVGQSTQLSVQGEGEWSWESSDESVACITPEGVLEAKAPGDAVVTAHRSSGGGEALTRSVRVYDAQLDGEDVIEFGSFVEYDFTRQPYEGRWLLTSSNKEVATCVFGTNSEGKATFGLYALGAGKTTITASLVSNRNVSVSMDVTVSRKSLDTVQVSWPESTSLPYTGSQVQLKPKCIWFHHDNVQNDSMLQEGRDYSLSYSGNTGVSKPEAGRLAKVTVTGRGNFYGSVEKSYAIVPAKIVPQNVAGVQSSYVYTSSAICPRPEVAVNGRKLVKGSDYTVTYKNNVNAGTATLVVTGQGNYAGSASKTFAITKAKVAVPAPASGLVFKGSVQVGVKEGANYRLSGTVSATKAGRYTATAALADPANHIWADGVSAARTLSWTIAPASMKGAKATCAPSSATYTGKAIKPSVTVKLGSKTLTKGADYTVSYTRNVKPGAALATVKAKGNYTGSIVCSFNIAKRANPIAVTVSTKSVKASKLAKKAVSVSPLRASKVKGAITYAKKSGAACLSVNKKTGKITVRKGTRKGMYKAIVSMKAAGDECYLPKRMTKTVTVKVG